MRLATRRSVAIMAAVLSVLATSSLALAHPPPFFWMTDLSADRRAGASFTLGNPAVVPPDNAIALATDVYLDYGVSRAIAVQVRFPLTMVLFDEAMGGDDTATALGNLSLGVQATSTSRLGRGGLVRTGGGMTLYLPTASSGGSSGAAAAATSQLYLPDRARWFADTTTARFRGDLRIETGILFFQSELDLDAQFRDGDDDLDLVFGVGPGLALSHNFAMLVELTISDITDEEDTTLDAGFRYHTRSLMTGLRFYLPLDDPWRDTDVFGASFDLGARF